MKLFSKSILITAVAAALVLVLGSCDLFAPKTDPISATETMQGFIAAGNSDASSGVYLNLKGYTHSDAHMYNTATNATWDQLFGTYGPLEDLYVSGNSATAVGEGPTTFSFTLAEDEPDQYKIRTITYAGGTIFQ